MNEIVEYMTDVDSVFSASVALLVNDAGVFYINTNNNNNIDRYKHENRFLRTITMGTSLFFCSFIFPKKYRWVYPAGVVGYLSSQYVYSGFTYLRSFSPWRNKNIRN